MTESRSSRDDILRREGLVPESSSPDTKEYELTSDNRRGEDLEEAFEIPEEEPSGMQFAGGKQPSDALQTTAVRIPARIVGIASQTVRLDCLLDEDEGIFEEREFDRALLEGTVPIEQGRPVWIRIRQVPGRQTTEFLDGAGSVNEEPFDDIPGLDRLEEDDFKSVV